MYSDVMKIELQYIYGHALSSSRHMRNGRYVVTSVKMVIENEIDRFTQLKIDSSVFKKCSILKQDRRKSLRLKSDFRS